MDNSDRKIKMSSIKLIGILLLLYVLLFVSQEICGYNALGICWGVWEKANMLMELFLIVIPVFVFGLVIYFLKEGVFRSWINFTKVWVPLTIVLSLLTPEYGGSGIVTIDRGLVSFSLSALYVVVSIILIAYKSWRLRER